MPATAEHGAIEPVPVKTVALFGLAKASSREGPHAGNGLGVSIDITETANALMARTGARLDQIEVRVEQPAAAVAGDITVDNVTVVSQQVE
jgi:tyrosinase